MKKIGFGIFCFCVIFSFTGGISLAAENDLQLNSIDVDIDSVIENLTEEDYVEAFNRIGNSLTSSDLSEEDKNNLAIQTYADIYHEKLNSISVYYLPKAYKDLNDAEKKLVKTYPSQAALVYVASDLATKRTNALYKTGTHNGNGDAFRHAYWNAEMATMLAGYGAGFNPKKGRTDAKRWADAHEQTPGQPALEKSMDLYNNNIGRNIVTKKMSSKSLEKAALEKVKNGSCRRIVSNKLAKTNSTGLK